MLAAPSSGGAAYSHPGLDPGSHTSWHEVWQGFDIDPQIAEAVVWSEMERYDRLQDALESDRKSTRLNSSH